MSHERVRPTAAARRIRIGISGWTYPGWRGVFYPDGLPARRELAYAAARFAAIEINATHYRLQTPASFGRWRDETPDGFVFALKGGRYITHMLRAKEVDTALANFMASGVLRLGPKLGPMLWQFPPRQKFDPGRLEDFLAALPRTTAAAARLARRHDARLDGRAWVDCDFDGALRHAVEIRHDSFRTPAFVEMLRRHNAALVCADAVDWPLLLDATTDFVYCRLHGSQDLYASGYDAADIGVWARRIRAWARGDEPAGGDRIRERARDGPTRDVFVFFDNDAKVRAPFDAMALARRLGLRTRELQP